MTDEKRKPKVNSEGQKELDRCEQQFEAFDNQLKEMTQDRMAKAPAQEMEPQTKIAQRDIDKSKDIYLKPYITLSCREKFNEAYREDYNFAKEYVQFIAENKEIIGETIEICTKRFPGVPLEHWKVPVNKPVWGPRYLAEQIKGRKYHRLVMNQHIMTEASGMGQMYGALAVDTTVQRMDANPVSSRRSVFMGANF